jgi:hypothetical protein
MSVHGRECCKTPFASLNTIFFSSAQRWGCFFWMMPSPHGRALLAELCHSQIQNRLNDAAKLNECLATTH